MQAAAQNFDTFLFSLKVPRGCLHTYIFFLGGLHGRLYSTPLGQHIKFETELTLVYEITKMNRLTWFVASFFLK